MSISRFGNTPPGKTQCLLSGIANKQMWKTSVWHKHAACICLCAFGVCMHVYSKELRALLNNLDLYRWITIFWLQSSSVQFSSVLFCSVLCCSVNNFKRMIHPSMLSTEQIFLVPALAFDSKKDHRCLWGEKSEQNWGWIERTWGWCQDRQKRIKRRSSRTLALDLEWLNSTSQTRTLAHPSPTPR